jgi:D-alanyl-D-alanine carboxypeptidase
VNKNLFVYGLVISLCAIVVVLVANLNISKDGQANKNDDPEEVIAETNSSKNDKDLNIPEELKWALILVNHEHHVPKDFNVETTKVLGIPVSSKIEPYINNMIAGAKKEGVNLGICSGYRSFERQTVLYNNEVQSFQKKGLKLEEAQIEASRYVARPGESEHNTGLAVDFSSTSNDGTNLLEEFESTAEGKFLAKHCYEYGFILRYPKNKEYITKVSYEPWHFRFVGMDFAKKITDSGLSFDEYWDKYLKAKYN